MLLEIKQSSNWKYKNKSFKQTYPFQQANKCQRFFQGTQIQSEPWSQHFLVGNASTWCQTKTAAKPFGHSFTRSFGLFTWAMLSIVCAKMDLWLYRWGLCFPRNLQRLLRLFGISELLLLLPESAPGFCERATSCQWSAKAQNAS